MNGLTTSWQELSLEKEYLLQASDPDLADKTARALLQARAGQTDIRRSLLQMNARYRAAQTEMGVFARDFITNALRKD